jgi:hypothetical protein
MKRLTEFTQRTTLLSLTLGILVVGPTAAWAQESASDSYGGRGRTGEVVAAGAVSTPSPPTPASITARATPTPAAQVPRGTLPFTGFDLLLIAAGGSALVAAGFALRRLSRPVQPAVE